MPFLRKPSFVRWAPGGLSIMSLPRSSPPFPTAGRPPSIRSGGLLPHGGWARSPFGRLSTVPPHAGPVQECFGWDSTTRSPYLLFLVNLEGGVVGWTGPAPRFADWLPGGLDSLRCGSKGTRVWLVPGSRGGVRSFPPLFAVFPVVTRFSTFRPHFYLHLNWSGVSNLNVLAGGGVALGGVESVGGVVPLPAAGSFLCP